MTINNTIINKTVNTIGSSADVMELATDIRIMDKEDPICVEIRDFNAGAICSHLHQDDFSKLELGREYNAAEVYAMFEDGPADHEMVYAEFYCLRDYHEDAIAKVYEDDNIIVVLVCTIEFLWNHHELAVDYGELKNTYYVFNKAGN